MKIIFKPSRKLHWLFSINEIKVTCMFKSICTTAVSFTGIINFHITIFLTFLYQKDSHAGYLNLPRCI